MGTHGLLSLITMCRRMVSGVSSYSDGKSSATFNRTSPSQGHKKAPAASNCEGSEGLIPDTWIMAPTSHTVSSFKCDAAYTRLIRCGVKHQKAEDCSWLLSTIKHRRRKGQPFTATDNHLRSSAFLKGWTKYRFTSAKKVLVDHGLLKTTTVITDRGVATQWEVA